MALDALIVAILPNHGITDFASFEDFDDAAILAIMRQVNRDPALPDFGQHSYMRFCTACEAVKYYTTVTTAMMRWSTVLKNFHNTMLSFHAILRLQKCDKLVLTQLPVYLSICHS